MSRESEADLWAARMQGPNAARYRAAFEAWSADPRNAAAYREAIEEYDGAAGVSARTVEEGARAFDTARRRRQGQWAMAAALVLTLAAGFAWTAMRGDPETQIADAATGEQILADGTRVLLMDGARIETHFTAGERRVAMTGGRARFTVAHDPARPFRVAAGASLTTALGTIFEIDLSAGTPRVHLLRGSVEVAAADGTRPPLRLAPGESAEVGGDGPRRVPAMTSPVAGPAATTLIEADGLPLGAVIESANRVNARPIRLADPALGALRLTGRFDVAGADALARKLAAALDLVVEAGPDGPVLASRKEKRGG